MYIYTAAEFFVIEMCTPGSISIINTLVHCRPYIMAYRRVMLSNVLLDIPNESLTPSLFTFGKPASHISKLSISTVNPDLKHINSFRRLVCMIIPNIEKTSYKINLECDGLWYVIYVSSDDVTCMNYHKTDHVARNCYTTAQSILCPVTFADISAGKVTNPPSPSTAPVPVVSRTGKQSLMVENTTAFPLLIQPRQKLRSTARASVTSNPHVITNSVPIIEHSQTHTDGSEKQEENCQASVSTDPETPEPSVDIPTTHASEM
jgi:hypothetical protein